MRHHRARLSSENRFWPCKDAQHTLLWTGCAAAPADPPAKAGPSKVVFALHCDLPEPRAPRYHSSLPYKAWAPWGLRLCALLFSSGDSSGFGSPQTTICFWIKVDETIHAQTHRNLFLSLQPCCFYAWHLPWCCRGGEFKPTQKEKNKYSWTQIMLLCSFQCVTLQADSPCRV